MATNDGFLMRSHHALEKGIRALTELQKTIDKDLKEVIKILKARKGRIIVTGIGKSGFIGMKISATLVSLGNPAVFLHPADALHGDTGMVSDGDVVFAISFSGRSAEVVKIVKYLKKEFQISVVSVTGNKESPLAKISDAHILLHIKDEGSPHGFAPMASTTASLVVGDMIASALTSPTSFQKGQFARFHPGGGLALEMHTVETAMTKGKDIPLVSSQKFLKDALKEMSGKFLGVTGVVDAQKKLIGIITDGDVRRFLLSHDFESNVTVTKLMNDKPKFVSKDASLKEALVLMEKFHITSLFVLDGKERPVGIIHIHTIVGDTVNF